MSIMSTVDIYAWKSVPSEVARIAKAASGTYSVLRELTPYLPDINARLWYNPDTKQASLSYPLFTDSEKVAAWHIALRQVPGVDSLAHGYFYQPSPLLPNIRVKTAEVTNSDIFGPPATLMHLKPNSILGAPTPLTSTLAGGLLGAGLGYGGGWLAEQLLPEDKFERGKLRRMTSLIGGIAGAVPGLWHGFDNMRAHPDESMRWSPRAWLSSYPWTTPTARTPQAAQNRFQPFLEGLERVINKEAKTLDARWIKYADDVGGDLKYPIPVDQFNRVIWNDLSTAGGYTPPHLAAATTGLLQAASLSQGGANFVTPMDIARIGIGMGSGYMSGLAVGKTLGALAGLRPEAQQSLQQAGTWAGLLSNIVPLAFR